MVDTLLKAFLSAFIEIPMPIWARWVAFLPGQPHDGFTFLAAIGENFQDEAFIPFLDYFYLDRLHRHKGRTPLRLRYGTP
jgi:hypothetical protein